MVDFRNNFYLSKYEDTASASIGPVMVIEIVMFLLRLWNEKDLAHGKSDEHSENVKRIKKVAAEGIKI